MVEATAKTWFGRDPAAITAQGVSLVIAVVMLLPMPEGVSAALIAVAIAAGGVIVAFAVARDGQLAAITGLGRAGIAFAVVLGVPWSETYQALLLVAAEQLFAVVVIRDRVKAKVDETGAAVVNRPVAAPRLS
jgi:hypothetical protein